MPDLREVIHAWIREDAPLTVKMTLYPEHVQKLVDRLSALRDAGTGRDSGEAAKRYVAGRMDMREDAANAVFQMARTRRSSNDGDLSSAALHEAALMIRTLPLQTGSDSHD